VKDQGYYSSIRSTLTSSASMTSPLLDCIACVMLPYKSEL